MSDNGDRTLNPKLGSIIWLYIMSLANNALLTLLKALGELKKVHGADHRESQFLA